MFVRAPQHHTAEGRGFIDPAAALECERPFQSVIHCVNVGCLRSLCLCKKYCLHQQYYTACLLTERGLSSPEQYQ